MQASGKDYGLSVIRLTALSMVVFCHFFEQYSTGGGYILGNYLASGVQVFLLLSGYLHGKKEFPGAAERAGFIKRSFQKILLDYYVYLILVAVPAYWILERSEVTVASLIGVFSTSGTLLGIHHFWYIPYCLFCYLATPFLYDIKEAWVKGQTVRRRFIRVLCLCLLCHFIFTQFSVYFRPEQIICYIIGYFIPLFTEKLILRMFPAITVSMLVTNIIRYYYRYVWVADALPERSRRILEWNFRYAYLFLGLFVFLLLYIVTRETHIPQCCKKFLNGSDALSYDIYITHMIYIKGCLQLPMELGFFNRLIITLLISIISGILLNTICKKIIPFLYCAISSRWHPPYSES